MGNNKEGMRICSSICLGDYTYTSLYVYIQLHTYIAILPFVLRMNDDCIPLRASGSQATSIILEWDNISFCYSSSGCNTLHRKDLDIFNFQLATPVKQNSSSPW